MLLQAPKVGFIFPNTKCLGTPCSHRLLLKRLERDKQLWDTPHDVFSHIYLLWLPSAQMQSLHCTWLGSPEEGPRCLSTDLADTHSLQSEHVNK